MSHFVYVAASPKNKNSSPVRAQPSSDARLLHQGRQPERGPSPSLPRGRGQVLPPQAQSPQNASRRKPVPTSPESVRGPPATYAHRRSNSLSGMNQGVANLNRWSRSTASSVASTQSTHQKPPSTRRMSVSGSTTFLLGADNSSPPPKTYRNNPSTAYQSNSTRSGLDSSLTLLPPIITLPSLQTSGNNHSSPLTGQASPSPSTAGILSAAVRSTVPDYFAGPVGESTTRGAVDTADSPSADRTRDNHTSKRPLGEDEKRGARGHSRHRSGKGSSTGSSNRQSKQPSQKNMLSKALQKANTAVLLDNAQNFEGAMEAYSEACTLLQQVMTRSSGDEDKRKLEAIRNTYTSRINELKRITPHLQDDGKALPDRPESGSYRGQEFQLEDEEEEPAFIETATATRIVNDQSYVLDPKLPRSIPTSQLPVRRESLMPSAFDPFQYGGLDPAMQRAHSKSPMRERTLEMNVHLAPPMDSTYMPPPLSPRHPPSPMAFPPENNTHHRQETSEPHATSRAGSAPLRGHTRVPSNESMSWLDTIDESGGSTASSNHSRSSSMGVRRRRIRAARGSTEVEFDAALDAAVEAAYDDGFEPVDSSERRDRYDYDDADDDEIVANVRRKVELAKERVRQTERETAIHDARERERKRLQSRIEAQSSLDDEYGNESEEEERMLEEMTRDYVMDGFEFGLQSKSALPRESDSSGFSGRTWNSSIGSNPTTAGTTLSTVTEAALVPEVPLLQNKAINHPPPSQALPPVPSSSAAFKQAFAPAAQGVRGRRLSGQNPKQLKIETTTAASDDHVDLLSQPPSMPPPRVPDSAFQLKTTVPSPQRPSIPGGAGRPIPQPIRQASSPFPSSNNPEIISPPTPTLARTFTNESDSNGLPRSGSPGRTQSRAGLRKNFSSSSLKNVKSRNLSVSNADDGSDVSPNTPASSQFNSRDGRLPAMPALPTPIATAFKDKINGAPTGGLYLFNNDINSPESPSSPNPMASDAPIPLEPCPNEFLLRPFWLMRALYQTIAHPRGGYLSTKLFVPCDVWKVKGVKIKSIEDKISNCDFLTAALLNLANVDTFDADAVLEEMQALEGVLEQVQVTLTKKLGNDVGVQGSGGIFKDMPVGGDNEGNNTSKSGNTSTKSSFSWRRLRSKNSGAALSNSYANKAAATDGPKEGLSMSTLPMTSTALAKVRFAKRDVREVQCSGPNAHYMGALARLFDAAQTIDQIARQVEDPGLRHADKTQVGLELCTRHAAEFFGFYICRFVLADVALLLDKFIKRGSEWVLV